ncbi:hypothetical protein SAMN04488112_11847 [Melghirimyces thermohalophilus]|uniref:Uncharacterized protein n=1 Tax=Melghirimyces thermohalophilus TaxID=1236220 RepID=A0A1G6PW61_9BACL|nr:hypothetical protein [Melghirimyces thermohalophilus]SDC83756.1 hypothetical protein SAMN04488112_11847 [Melghirimyces thermohalophilus]
MHLWSLYLFPQPYQLKLEPWVLENGIILVIPFFKIKVFHLSLVEDI